MGGGDHAHVDRRRLGRAQPADLAALERAQELDLQRGRHFGDLVQEHRAAAGLLEEPELADRGPREGAPHVAEELGLEQRLRHRAAVDGHERTGCPRARVVHGLGDDLLARAGLAQDQHGRVGWRHPLHEVEDGVHGRRLRDHAGDAVAFAELGAQVLVLATERAAGQGLVDAAIELFRLLALLEVVQRAEADRLLGRLPLRVGGQQDHLGRGSMRLGRPQHVEAIAVRHPEIGDDEVEDLPGQELGRGGDAIGLDHVVAPLAEQQGQRAPRRRLVVHDQQVGHGQATSSGNSSVTRVPRPGAESISMRPPWAATMRSAMVRPRPLPFGLPE